MNKAMNKETSKKMNSLKQLGLCLVASLALASLLCAAPAGAVPPPGAAPAWQVSSLATPTNFVPGDTTAMKYNYDLRIVNVGAKVTDGSPITITDTLPKGLTVQGEGAGDHGALDCGTLPTSPGGSCEFELFYTGAGSSPLDFGKKLFGVLPSLCKTERAEETTTVTCTIPSTVPPPLPPTADEPSNVYPSEELRLRIFVEAPEELEGESFAGKPLENHVKVSGGGAEGEETGHNATASFDEEGNPVPAGAGFSFYHATVTGPDGQAATVAASHPYQWVTSYAVNTMPPLPGNEGQAEIVPAGGDVKDVKVTLPPGLVGNPNATPRCTAKDFQTISSLTPPQGGFYQVNGCPPDTAVGIVIVQEVEGISGSLPVPLYNLVPSPGEPATLGFQVGNVPFYIHTEVRPEDGYKVVSILRNQTQQKRVSGASVIVWGNPSAESHNGLRGRCLDSNVPGNRLADGEPGPCEGAAGLPPFLRLPTSCPGSTPSLPLTFNNWTDPGSFLTQSSSLAATSGCAAVPFEPSLEARPTTDVADSPTGLHADLHIPQPQDPAGLGEADLRKTVVTLPDGLVLNPSSANGLGSCSIAQVGYLGGNGDGVGKPFSNDPANCPEDSKIGTVEVDTPLIDHPLPGAVYVATPHDNPFDSLLAIYVTVHDPATGIVVKLPGHVEPDPNTGRLKATFDNTPQVPFEDFKLDFFGGPGAALRTPQACGNYSTDSVMTPWSSPPAGTASSSDGYSIDRNPSAAPCPTSEGALPRAYGLNAGTEAPVAGAYSPLVMNLSRPDGTQQFGRLTVTPPPGLLARLAGIPYCPEANLAAAASKSGKDEQAAPSCPAASRVGSVRVGAGAGPKPYYTAGAAYLAGPYKGAQLSLAIVTPAVAGPYDIGTVVVRTALHVNPVTAQITAISDPIPHILQGIPLDVRSVAVRLDHPGWGLNPTSCAASVFGAGVFSTVGQATTLANRFQVGACRNLGFKPRLYTRLYGGTGRGGHPKLRAVLIPRPGNANISRAAVTLPRSEFLDQANIRTVCTRVQFAAGACPPGAIYGRAVAFTPLLAAPLSGPVYLRSSNHKLPDLVLDLHGQVDIEASARIDSKNKGIRTTFEAVPDAPVSKLVLYMKGGKKKGLLVNSRNICAKTYRATANLKGHNGHKRTLHPKLKNSKCKKHKKKG
jgi:hypothetical protein